MKSVTESILGYCSTVRCDSLEREKWDPDDDEDAGVFIISCCAHSRNKFFFAALYSFKDWHHLEVRNMDIGFVYEVLSEGIKILNKCEIYFRYQDERNAKFKLTPRKITKVRDSVLCLTVLL